MDVAGRDQVSPFYEGYPLADPPPRKRSIRHRLLLILLALIPVSIIVLVILALIGPIPLNANIWMKEGGVVGNPEYCNHSITAERAVRLVYTPIAFPDRIFGHKIDPNNYQHEVLSNEFMMYGIIVVPYFNYEVTQDGGVTWKQFWRFNNIPNYFPPCDNFASLDEENFWLWTWRELAVTHDAGKTWIVKVFMRDGSPSWDTFGNLWIDTVEFQIPAEGGVIFRQRQREPDPSFLTHDGGKTWHPDPAWTPPTQSSSG